MMCYRHSFYRCGVTRTLFLWCELRVGIVVCGMDFFLRTLHPLFFFLIISISFLTLVYHRSMWYHFTRSVCLPNYHRCGRYSSVGSSIAHHSSTRPDPVRECCFVLWYWSEPVPFFFLTSLLLFTCLVVVATTIIDLAGTLSHSPCDNWCIAVGISLRSHCYRRVHAF